MTLMTGQPHDRDFLQSARRKERVSDVRRAVDMARKPLALAKGAFPDGHRPNIMVVETRLHVRTEMSGIEKRGDEGPTTGTVVKAKPKTKKPSMYKVLMLNDDYTPMEFVVHILERFFSKTRDEATRIMLHVHRRGVGICGVFTYEVAESKVTQVMDFARQHQHPLQCTLEKE
jgi:ATP-dependent Clp protease adaptor protein ClpS